MMLRILMTTVAAGALAACSGSKEPEASASAAAAPSEAAAIASAVPTAAPVGGAVATPAKGAAPTKEFMVGSWGDNGDCGMAISFKADGSMVGPFEKWELDSGVLTMVGNPQKMHLTVVDGKTMESRLDGTGSPRKLTRCP